MTFNIYIERGTPLTTKITTVPHNTTAKFTPSIEQSCEAHQASKKKKRFSQRPKSLSSMILKKKPKEDETLEAIRVAAYFFKSLTKTLVRATDIPSSVERILQKEVQVVTYRVLGYLLLGIVRIYSKKVDYLLTDCQEVLLGIKNFAVPTREDLLAEAQKAPYFSITLPDCFELDAFDLEVFDDNTESNVVPVEQITLKDSILRNASTEQHALHGCLFEDVAGSYYPCSAKHTPFEEVLLGYGIDVSLRKSLNIDGLTTTFEMMKEEAFSQRECSDLMAAKTEEEPTRNSDKLVDEDHRDNTEKIKDPDGVEEYLIEACPDCITSNLEPEMEKLRSDMCYGGEKPMDCDMLCGSKDPRETAHSLIEENHKDEDEMLKYKEINEIMQEEKNSVSMKPDKATDTKIPDSERSATPRLMALSTPAPKERSRIHKKIKCVFDETIVLPKELMKRTINDASDLVSKRRKVAYTPFSIWRASRTFPRDFYHPTVFTGLSPELRSLYMRKKMEILKSTKTMERPEALAIPSITISGVSETIGIIAPETPIRNSNVTLECINIAPMTPAGMSEQRDIAPDTPLRNSTTANLFECPMTPQTPHSESTMITSFGCFGQNSSPCRDELLDLTGLDEMKSSLSDDTTESWGWSGRTRMVAKFLHRSFLSRKEQAEEGMLNLSQIVEGRTKKESARVFYEILVLSSKGCVDVKQDGGYGDILVHKHRKFDETCGANRYIEPVSRSR